MYKKRFTKTKNTEEHSYYLGSETGFQRVLEWFWDVYTIQECPIPDSRTESERILTSSNMTFLGREILRIRRVAL